MKLFNLHQFTKGWFVGNFSPTILPSDEVEVAIKRYKVGDHDNSHYHLKADEITVIVSGTVKMNDVIYKENDVIWIEKNELTDFTAITDAVTCVVKIPCVKGDKYEIHCA
jgi:hypothetical protein